MRLLFRQKIFSWFDSFDIFDEAGNTVYTVKGQLSWGHCLKIFDSTGSYVGMVKQRVITFLPTFDIYMGDNLIGSIKKEFSLLRPKYDIDFNGWHVDGSLLEWDYTIRDTLGSRIATISKELLHMSDTYTIDVTNPYDALYTVMLVLAIDAEKCSRN
jgi:uncharacterized protein YxjI